MGSDTCDGVPTIKRGFDLGCCGGTVRLEPDSMLLSDEGIASSVWTHQYLGDCPHCEKKYPWMRPLADAD